MNKDALAVLLLTNQLVRVDTKPLTAREVRSVRAAISEFGEILHASANDLVSDHGIEPAMAERIERLCAASTAFVFEMERLEESGIRIVPEGDERYPKKVLEALGVKSAAFLLVAGDSDLLEMTARGIVGSRNVGTEAMSVAVDAAGVAVANGEVVVSGLARGIDRESMSAALAAGGKVIGVPSEGIRRVAKSNEVRAMVHDGTMCLISPYGPDATFSVGRAMGRNRFIYALAASTLVVASDARKGGTWAGATEALKEGFGAVDVWMGEGAAEGNSELAELGARAVRSRDEFWSSPTWAQPAKTVSVPFQPRLF